MERSINRFYGDRSKLPFGTLEVGEGFTSIETDNKKSVRSYMCRLNRISGKRYRMLSDKQGFVVLRIA